MKSNLKVEPVSLYKTPKYPTKEAVRANPLILNALPQRWRAMPALCVAVSLTLSTGLFGCSKDIREDEDDDDDLRVSVPFFAHGEGRGSYGCVMVAPAVYLSEEEALQIIKEEAEAKGVVFDDTRTIRGARFPATNIFPGDDEYETWNGSLELDGYDSDLKIGFEYVSENDVMDWVKETDVWCSVSDYDMKGTAERLSKVVKNTAVFYDPGTDFEALNVDWEADSETIDRYFEQYESEQKERMLEDLRAQVRDFLDWLAAEDII
ncbi:MAG: hypothetical protein JW817_02625 [Clostridiales bacterium]|nr:hypothetical protein [Clostridiales bacterium]